MLRPKRHGGRMTCRLALTREEEFDLKLSPTIGPAAFARWLERGAGNDGCEDGGFAIAARVCELLTGRHDDAIENKTAQAPISDPADLWNGVRGLGSQCISARTIVHGSELGDCQTGSGADRRRCSTRGFGAWGCFRLKWFPPCAIWMLPSGPLICSCCA